MYQSGLFGFSAYQERILAMQVPVNRVDAPLKKAIFQNVLNTDSSQFNILAYAQFLAFEARPQAALAHIKAACIMVRDVSDCDNVDADLSALAEKDPATFSPLYQQFRAWRQDNPEKTGLK